MLTKPYGTTGIDATVIGFGAMRFPQPKDTEAMAAIVRHAFDRGINYFDTAPAYCEGLSEGIFGAAFRTMPRDKYYVATKSNKADASELRRDVETSLERMGVDSLDVLHIWWVLSLEAYRGRVDGGAVAEAIKLKEEGLVKHLAISSHMRGDELAVVLDDSPFEGVLLGYNATNFPTRQAAVDFCGDKKLGVVAMNPLAGGVIPQNPETFSFLKGDHSPSVVAGALRFIVSQPAITTALVGFSSTEHVDQAVDAVADFIPYSQARMDEIGAHILDSFDGLCTGCGYCLPCPKGVPIPAFMDLYNHSILTGGEGVTGRMKWHWGIDPASGKACTDCGLCETKCTQHLPIRERLQAVLDAVEEE